MLMYLFKTFGLSLLCAALLCVTIIRLTPDAFASEDNSSFESLDTSKALVNKFSLHAISKFSKNEIPVELVVTVNEQSGNIYSDKNNAIMVLASFLDTVQKADPDFELSSFDGSAQRSETANIAVADIVLNKKNYEVFIHLVDEAKIFFTKGDTLVSLVTKKIHRPVLVLDEESKRSALSLPVMMSEMFHVHEFNDNSNCCTVLNLRSFSVNTHGVEALAVVSSANSEITVKVEQNLLRMASLLGYAVCSSNNLEGLSNKSDVSKFEILASNSFSDQGVW